MGITALVTIGGDDTAFSASQVYKRAGGAIKVAHVPKTIDNDLPLPGSAPTFGFETARHYGVFIVRNLAEDSKTTGRWYVIVSMGRAAGHLALGIGKASAATLTLIPEEFPDRSLTPRRVVRHHHRLDHQAEGAGQELRHGRARRGADREDRRGRIARGDGRRGATRPIRVGSSATRTATCGSARSSSAGWSRTGSTARLTELGLTMTLIDKDLGYELRCADPIPFDAEYTRNLGYGAVKFLLSPEAAKFGAVISFDGRHDEAAAVRHDDQPGDRADAAAEGGHRQRDLRVRPAVHDPAGAGRLRRAAGCRSWRPWQT